LPSSLYEGLAAWGAVPRFVGASLGTVESVDGDPIEPDAKLEAVPAVLYDALVVPGGRAPIQMLGNQGHATEFVKEQYRHCQPILMLGAGQELVENAGVPLTLSTGDPDSWLLRFPDEHVEEALALFVEAIT
jgi:catalase